MGEIRKFAATSRRRVVIVAHFDSPRIREILKQETDDTRHAATAKARRELAKIDAKRGSMAVRSKQGTVTRKKRRQNARGLKRADKDEKHYLAVSRCLCHRSRCSGC